MSTSRRLMLANLASVAIAALASAPLAHAQAPAYPSRPLRIIVPFSAGTSADIFARMVAQRLQDALGQSVVVDNRAGANGVIGIDALAKAAPDGYTIGLGSNGTQTINVNLYTRLPYDPIRDFAPITYAYGQAFMLLAPAAIAPANLKDYVAAMRTSPGAKTMGYTATGAQLASEFFRMSTQLPITLVAYKSSANAATDLIGGHIDLRMDSFAGGQAAIKGGRVRALAVTTHERSALLPNVPTVAESGYPGFEASGWVGFFAPAGTPADIVQRLNSEIAKAFAHPETRAQLVAAGIEPKGSTPEALQAMVRDDIAKWAKVFREAKIPRADSYE